MSSGNMTDKTAGQENDKDVASFDMDVGLTNDFQGKYKTKLLDELLNYEHQIKKLSIAERRDPKVDAGYFDAIEKARRVIIEVWEAKHTHTN